MAKPGRRREWARPIEETDVFPPVTDDDPEPGGGEDDSPAEPAESAEDTSRAKRFGQQIVDRLPQLSVAIVAGLALCVSFPPVGWWYMAIAAFGLLAWALTRDTTTLAGGFGYGFLFGLVFYLPLLPWIGGFVGAIPWIALCIVQALFPGLFGLAAVAVRRLSGWPFWFAALWATQEWLKSTVPFGGFPWGAAGFSQTNGPLLGIAQLGGAPLLSFAVALIGFSLAAIAFEVVKWWRHNDDFQKSAPPAVVLPGVCISAVLLATALAWPHARQSGLGAGDEPTITVAAVQGNVPRLGLEFNAQRRAVLDNHVRETVRLSEDVRAGRAPQPMVVIWPENSSDIDPLANADAREVISAAATAIKAPILVGGVVAAPGSPDNPASTNSVIVWNPGTGPADRHDKQIVQPFGEYLPWRSFFGHLSSYADRAGYFVPGDGTGVVTAAGVPIGVTTCWEVIFDRAARESVQNGAQLLVVPSNNATFNEAMSEQQLAFGRLRAVEHDRYVVVAGTTGISAIIAPDGRQLASTAFFEPAYLDMQVRLKTQLTFATRWGPMVQGLLVALGVGAVITAILHNGSFVRRLGRRSNDKGAT
jgi:apolipoprotein N-acyltransferase